MRLLSSSSTTRLRALGLVVIALGFVVACNAVTGIDGYSTLPPPTDCIDCIHQECTEEFNACVHETGCSNRAACIQTCTTPGDLTCLQDCIGRYPAGATGNAMLSCATDQCFDLCLERQDTGPGEDTGSAPQDAGARDGF